MPTLSLRLLVLSLTVAISACATTDMNHYRPALASQVAATSVKPMISNAAAR